MEKKKDPRWWKIGGWSCSCSTRFLENDVWKWCRWNIKTCFFSIFLFLLQFLLLTPIPNLQCNPLFLSDVRFFSRKNRVQWNKILSFFLEKKNLAFIHIKKKPFHVKNIFLFMKRMCPSCVKTNFLYGLNKLAYAYSIIIIFNTKNLKLNNIIHFLE